MGEVMSLYGLPEYFRRGYERALLAYDLEQLQKRGVRDVYLWVLKKNKCARAFYESMGFVPNGDRASLEIGGQELMECRYRWRAERHG